MAQTSLSYDIVIVGGGLTGTTLALALRDTPWRIALIEAQPAPQHPQTTHDLRMLALSWASQHYFQQLTIWPAVERQATPIEKIHISEKGHFGNTLLSAAALNLPALGYTVPIIYLYQALCETLLQQPPSHFSYYCPAQVSDVQQHPDGWQITVNEETLTTHLLIAADGAHSFIRQQLAIPTVQRDYTQQALVSNIGLNQPPPHTAYERFTPDGILALLPIAQQRMAVIWTLTSALAEQYAAAPEKEFIAFTQQAIGQRIGKICDIGKRQTYPLQTIQPQQQTLPNLLLLGNAAHTLHPVAAQGFNLGLRDTLVLAKLLTQTTHLPNNRLLEEYSQQRQQDQQQTQNFTERLIDIFAPQYFPLPTLRGLGLAAFDLLPGLKRRFCWKRIRGT